MIVHKYNLLNKIFHRIFVLGLFAYSFNSSALTFPLPAHGDVVGDVKIAIAKEGQDLAHIARAYDMGYVDLEEANPNINPNYIKAGTVIIIPSQFILPNAPRDGIVINLAEMRLYYYPKSKRQVITYPIGIGREGDDTPIGVLKIIEHIPNPTWHVPQSILKSQAMQGINLPKAVPPGPENPLGKFAMRLSNPSYLIHGTNDPYGGIGRRSSSGCLRLYPEDIANLYRQTPKGTNLYILNEPYKAGWHQQRLYIESHVALEAKDNQALEDTILIKNVIQLATKGRQTNIDWDKTFEISGETQGIPQMIGASG